MPDVIVSNDIDAFLKTANDVAARAELGVAIGTDVQAHSAALDAVTGTNTGDEVAATDTTAGIVELATQAEVDAGVDTSRVVTPNTLANYSGLGGATEGTAILSTGETGGTKFLREDGDGTCSWQTVAGGGGGGTVQNANLSIQPTDEGTVAGNARGTNAVDLQMFRTAASQVASGTRAAIIGGQWNSATGSCSTVSGGYACSASNSYAAAIGGYGNDATGSASAVIGGFYNNAHGNWGGACIAGAGSSTVTSSAVYGFVGGGYSNTCSAYYTAAIAGSNNIVNSANSVVIGGSNNNTNSLQAVIIAGSNITAQRADTLHCNNLTIKNIPTSSAGLSAGDVWNDGGTLKIV